MKIIIIGAGLAGSIAYKALSSYSPEMYEAKEYSEDISDHSAIMRIRNLDVAKYLGCPYKEIRVEKFIKYDGKIYDKCTPKMNNLYSRKLYGSIAERSVMSLGRQKRYLLDFKAIKDDNTHYGMSLTAMSEGTAAFILTSDLEGLITPIDLLEARAEPEEYDICISTIPMFVMNDICKSPFARNIPFHGITIYSTCLKLSIGSDVHQTLYYPDPDCEAYRATLQDNILIIESLEPLLQWELESVVDDFGIDKDSTNIDKPLHFINPHSQAYGKLHSMDDDVRKSMILWLTEQFNIYSFGRYAVWKSLRADHLIDDIEKIKHMIKVGEVSRNYYNKLGG